MPFYIPISIHAVEIEVIQNQGYRSHSYHKNVKHCFEANYIGQNTAYHIGFSPYDSTRAFVSLLRASTEKISLFQRRIGFNDAYPNQTDYDITEDQRSLICLNSEKRIICVYIGNKEISFNYSPYTDLDDNTKWYVFIDAPYQAVSYPSRISINLGFQEFHHSLPSGYLPWIYGIDGMIRIAKKTITTFHHTSSWLYIFVLSF